MSNIKETIEASKNVKSNVINDLDTNKVKDDNVVEDQNAKKKAGLASKEEKNIGGMTFRRKAGVYDYSQEKTLDIPLEAKDNNLYYRFINDDRGRLERAEANGYAKVDNLIDPTTGQEVTTKHRVGTKPDGTALYAYLMATPKEWREERKKQAEKVRRDKEIGLARSLNDGNSRLDNNFYVKDTTQIRN